jgi:hypothetical protein
MTSRSLKTRSSLLHALHANLPRPILAHQQQTLLALPEPKQRLCINRQVFQLSTVGIPVCEARRLHAKIIQLQPYRFHSFGAIANTKIGFPLFPDFFSILPVALSCYSIAPSAPATTNVLPFADKLKSNGSSKPASAVYSSFPFRSYART